MNNLIIFLAVAILAVLVYKFWKPYTKPAKREVPAGKANLYFFYTDWCGFSQKAMPEWESVEGLLANTPYFGKTEVRPIRVNAEQDRKTALLYEVNAYPMILLEDKNGVREYTGRRTAGDILSFLRSTFGKESKSL